MNVIITVKSDLYVFSAACSLLTKQKCVTVPDTKEPQDEHKVTKTLDPWFNAMLWQGWVLSCHRLGLENSVQLSQIVVLDNRPQKVV